MGILKLGHPFCLTVKVMFQVHVKLLTSVRKMKTVVEAIQVFLILITLLISVPMMRATMLDQSNPLLMMMEAVMMTKRKKMILILMLLIIGKGKKMKKFKKGLLLQKKVITLMTLKNFKTNMAMLKMPI